MALPVCCATACCSPRLPSGGGASPSPSGLLCPPLHRPQQLRNSSRRPRRSSGIAPMDSGGAAALPDKLPLRWGAFEYPPSSPSVAMASTNPALGVSDADLATDDVGTLRLPPLPDKQVLAGVGTVTLDFLASVATFPDPDAKIRSVDSLAQGGGNVGNALTAAARLGLRPRIFSKLANDAAGIGICKEFESNGVDVSHIAVTEEGVSPFTYVIVDKETKTRTCIHTPGHPPVEPEDVSLSAIASFLNGVDLVYLDGRIPEASLPIAKEATKRRLPIIVDAERKREQLDEILRFADYLVTSAKFPQIWTGEATLADAVIKLAVLLPRLKFIIVTQGAKGCIMLEMSSSEAVSKLDPKYTEAVDTLDAKYTLSLLQEEAEEHHTSKSLVFSSKVCRLQGSQEAVFGRLLVGTAAPVAEVVDTTGAGDAFIGGITYGLLAGFPPERMLPLAATVAAAKCQALGARTGLPMRDDPKLLPLLL